MMNVESAASRLGIEQCNQPLSRGRVCVHVKDVSYRHSHSWQLGDARYLDVDGKRVDMETGEVVARTDFGTEQIIAEVKAERATWTREEVQAHARRVLEGQYGFKLPEDAFPIEADEPPAETVNVNYHHHGMSGWSYGTCEKGHSYERSPEGRLRRIHSRNERIEVVEYAKEHTAAEASRKFDIPVKTVRTWVNRSK